MFARANVHADEEEPCLDLDELHRFVASVREAVEWATPIASEARCNPKCEADACKTYSDAAALITCMFGDAVRFLFA